MLFTSNILSENSSMAKNSYTLESTSKPTMDSFLEILLKSNADIHTIESVYNCNYYKHLVESALGAVSEDAILEMNFKDVKQKLIKIVETIIGYLKKFSKFIKDEFDKNREVYMRVRKRDAEIKFFNLSSEVKSKKGTFKTFTYPNPRRYNGKQIGGAPTQSLFSHADLILNGKESSNDESRGSDNDMLKNAFLALARLIRTSNKSSIKEVVDAASFKKFVTENEIYTEQKEMTLQEWFDSEKNIDSVEPKDIIEMVSYINDELERLKNKLKNADNLDQKQTATINTYIAHINSIAQSITWFANSLKNAYFAKCRYFCNTINRASIGMGAKRESATIHGEPFDSDTLFGNRDFKDFNPTEWLDLNLTTECYQLEFEMVESYRRSALQEAIILSDDDPLKFNRIVSMQEAESGRLKDAVMQIINRIRDFIEQFFAKLRDKYGANARYIKSNSEIIAKPVNFGTITSKGDILAGLYRIQDPINLVPFNYETMKDDLKDKDKFFEKHILPSLKTSSPNSKRQVKWETGMGITEYCKAYFGASMPEDKFKPCEFTGKDIESNKQNITKYLTESERFLASIRSDLRKLEMEAKKNANSPASAATDTKQGNENKTLPSGGDNGSNSTTTESYFSCLYGTWFNEVEVDTGANNNGSGENAGNVNGNLDRSQAFKNYVACYKDVILSKLTAAEFITSELMQLIKKHVEMNGGNKDQSGEKKS